MKFLLVEDEEFNLIVLEEMIKILHPNAQATMVNNGKEAFEMLQNSSFDLILSDVNMPIMDGYTLIKKIKEELGLKTPTVAVTAFAIQGDKERLLMAGFDDYISKPIDMNELQNVISTFVL